MPEFSTPEARVPALPSPESVPTSDPAPAWLSRPDTPAPKLPMPDPPPAPVLKNPDDGIWVEFPKPGAAGMSMIGMLRGPALVRMSKPSGIAEMVVPVIVTAGMSTDASIGTTSDIEIPSMTEAGISTGMRIGIDSLNEIASRGMGSISRGTPIPATTIGSR
ncbi:Uncharacterised protein [Mycobacterium tuberculosis]|nr:Uncharacterised protein [Mycobacterium tuberculosis]